MLVLENKYQFWGKIYLIGVIFFKIFIYLFDFD